MIIPCPACAQPVSHISDATNPYRRATTTPGGQVTYSDPPPPPIADLDPVPMAYTVDPCGCRVTQDWAAAFAAETLRRQGGLPPLPVVDMTPAQRQKRLDRLQDQLTRLYKARSTLPLMPSQVEAVDAWVVIVADQMQRLYPPPAADTKPGQPVYRAADGTLSPVPAYDGQLPAGLVTTPPAKSAFCGLFGKRKPAAPPPDTSHMAAVKLAVKTANPRDLPTELLKRLHEYGVTEKGAALRLLDGLTPRKPGCGLPTLELLTRFSGIQANLSRFIAGTEDMTLDTAKYVSAFVDLIDVVTDSPAEVPSPVPEPPATPAISAEQAERSARRRRTIRKLRPDPP